MKKSKRQYGRITYEEVPGVIVVTLARPEELNLIDDDVFAELHDAFSRARFDESRSVVVLRGSGRMFSGGGNLGGDVATSALNGDPDFERDMREHVMAEYPVFEAIAECPKTTIAAVNGDAYGAAVDLIMFCDLAVMVRGATLCFAPPKWGVCDSPNAARLASRIGMARAKDLLFTSRLVTAEEAERIGLVNRLCDRAAFDAATQEYVDDVLTTSPEARRLMKKVANATLPPLSPEEHFESAVGPDFKEGVRSFIEKRPPSWTLAKSKKPKGKGKAVSSNGASSNGHAPAPPPYEPFRLLRQKVNEVTTRRPG